MNETADDQRTAYEGWAVLEDWRPVIGYEGVYEVSDHGRVRRVGKAARTGKGFGGGARVGRILEQHISRGYPAVQLWKLGKPEMLFVHRLVASAFIGPIADGMRVNHLNGVKTDRRRANLEITTSAGNNLHAYRAGLRVPVRGRPSPRRKPRLMITCACGCGAELETPDRKGRPRQFITGHNMRRAS